jgi:hypothetical protein
MDGDGEEGGEEGGDATESAARIRARQPTTFVRKGDEADGAMAAALAEANARKAEGGDDQAVSKQARRKVGFAMDGDGEEGGEEGGDATESAARIRARQPTTFVRKGDEMSSTFAEARAAAATVPGKSVEQQQMTQSAPQA